MRQRADRHVVGAGRRELRHPRQRHAARDLGLRPARGTGATASTMSAVDRLSSRMMSAPASSASSTCAEALRLDLGRHLAVRPAHARHRRHHALRQPDVVVLDQDAVVQPAAMIDAAAGAHGVLLERAQQRRRLARVEDDDAPAGGIDELPRQRGDAGEPLQEVERRALGRQQRRRVARDTRRRRCPARHALAVAVPDRDGDARIELAERLAGDVEAGEHAAATSPGWSACAF